MATQKLVTYLSFEELTDSQKEQVLEKHRHWNVEHMEWWDCVYYDAKSIGELLGIDIDNIYFSGFWSQGDGACFEGSFSYAKGMVKNVKEYAPLDEELHTIAKQMQELYRKSFYTLYGRIRQSGHYNHERSMSFDYDLDHGDIEDDEVRDIFADFALWIYKRLEKEYEYLTSDEVVAESIIANEMEFEIDEDGNLKL